MRATPLWPHHFPSPPKGHPPNSKNTGGVLGADTNIQSVAPRLFILLSLVILARKELLRVTLFEVERTLAGGQDPRLQPELHAGCCMIVGELKARLAEVPRHKTKRIGKISNPFNSKIPQFFDLVWGRKRKIMVGRQGATLLHRSNSTSLGPCSPFYL